MTPKRWQRVNEVFHSVLERAPGERADFLSQVCAGDEELRREVESLIRSDQQEGTFIGEPVLPRIAQVLVDDQTELTTGQAISHYKILKVLGAGGMGKVFLAEDNLLNRKVAIKLLPTSSSYDRELRARFIREAQLASSLDHANICTIYEVGEAAGRDFIVMQYVEGETLKQVTSNRPLSLESLLSISLQVAEALAAAHAQGIIHRDIKSSNIIITPRGQAKVLDFGLAKLLEGGVAEGGSGLTQTGAILGTPSYMSPEQARGDRVDHRSDIFSFGALMYEMATGQVAFKGTSQAETMNAVINEPHRPVGELNKEVPAQLSEVIDGALAKDAKGRPQAMEELINELRQSAQAMGMTSSSVPYVVRKPDSLIRRLTQSGLTGLFVVLLFVVGGILFYIYMHHTVEQVPMKVVPFTSFPGREDQAAFSPDGNQIAFVWDGEKGDNPDIYVKSIGGESSLRLTSDPAIDIRPAWAPDGQRIAFVRVIPSEPSFVIFVVSALGTSPERKLLSLTRGPSTIAWSPDGKLIAVSDAPSSGERPAILLFSLETGEKRNLTSPPAQFWADSNPAFSPDGKDLAFVRENTPVTGDIYIVPITGGEPRRVTYDNAKHNFDNGVVGGLAWTADGREVIFSSTRGGTPGLWRVAVSGGETRLAAGGDNTYYPTISRQGNRLAYTQVFAGTPVYRIGVPSTTARPGPATRLIASTRVDASPQYSPDGKRIAFESNRSGNHEIWMCDSEGRNPTCLTSFGKGYAGTPRWSPDGKQIAFDFRAAGGADVYVLSIEGGVPRRITTEASDDSLPSWSKDGRWIYFESNRGGNQQVWKEPAEGGQAVQVTKYGGSTTFESADGKYLYFSKGSLARGVWRIPVEGGEESLVLDQTGAGSWGSWALVDDGIYFINLESKGGPAVEFFSFDRHEISRIVGLEGVNEFVSGLTISPDRRWILYTQQDPISSDIMLVENFR